MQEIWKDIKGYEGKYQVSNLGNVRSLNWRNTGETKNLALKRQNRGYCVVNLGNKTYAVHRLVAEAFVPNPNNSDTVDHIDENILNNVASNLEWVSLDENIRRYYHNHPDQKGRPRINNQKIVQISKSGAVVKVWENLTDIKHQTGWSDWSIAECCRGKRNTAYGFKWQFAT